MEQLPEVKNYITSSRLVVLIINKSIGEKKGQLGFLTLPNNNKRGPPLLCLPFLSSIPFHPKQALNQDFSYGINAF